MTYVSEEAQAEVPHVLSAGQSQDVGLVLVDHLSEVVEDVCRLQRQLDRHVVRSGHELVALLAVGVLEVTLVVIDRRVVGGVEELHLVPALQQACREQPDRRRQHIHSPIIRVDQEYLDPLVRPSDRPTVGLWSRFGVRGEWPTANGHLHRRVVHVDHRSHQRIQPSHAQWLYGA